MLQPTRRLRTAYFGAILAVGLLPATLTACSPSPETADPAATRPNGTGITVPTANSATTGTTSTSGGFDVLANMPAAAKQHSNSGAQAFARYYVEAYGRLLMDPATGQLPKLHLTQCEECQGLATNISNTRDSAVSWKGLYYRVQDVTEPMVDGALIDAARVPEVEVVVLMTTVPVGVQEGTAPITTRPKGQDVLVQFRLDWREGQWYVADFRSHAATPATP